MKFKQLLAGSAAMLASSAAMAGSLTGNVGAVSTYMFRGIDQTSGAAIQGGVDYSFDFGLYTGLWVSNSATGASANGTGNEADVYVGYGLKLWQVNLDGGVIYYLYSEEDEDPAADNTDYAEVYLGAGYGPVAVKVFYAPEFGPDQSAFPSGDPDQNDFMYVTASATLNLNETVSFTPQVGFSAGDGAEDAFGDEYADYSLTATKKLQDGMAVSLAVIATDRELTVDSDDMPKFVVGFKKNFKI